jgi:hypothetical protein
VTLRATDVAAVLHTIEISNWHSSVEIFDPPEMIIVGMCRYEPGDPFFRAARDELVDNSFLIVLAQAAIDNCEVVAVMVDVEHIAVTNRE